MDQVVAETRRGGQARKASSWRGRLIAHVQPPWASSAEAPAGGAFELAVVGHARRDICESMLDQLARANSRSSELDEAFAMALADARPVPRTKAALAPATGPVHAARAIDVLAQLIADETTNEAACCEAIEGLSTDIVSAPSIFRFLSAETAMARSLRQERATGRVRWSD